MGLKHVLAHAAWTTEAAARALGTDYNGAYNYGGYGPVPDDPAIFTDTPMPEQLHARELPVVRHDASVGRRQGRPSNSESNERRINQNLDGVLRASAPYEGRVLKYETLCDDETCEASGLPNSQFGSKFHTGTRAARLMEAVGNRRVLEEIQLQESQAKRGESRRLPDRAFKVLDAPDLADDYYGHLLEWTRNRKMLAVALGDMVYLMSAATWPGHSPIYWALHNNAETVNSIKFDESGTKLAVGSTAGRLRIYDVATQQLDQLARGHLNKVCGLSWRGEGPNVLSSSSWDFIEHQDFRAPPPGSAGLPTTLHSQGTGAQNWVCGLEWSPDGERLASSGNNNIVQVWDAANLRDAVLYNDDSAACVRAVWDPHHPSILASGAGKDDRNLRIFNTASGRSTAGRMEPRATLPVGTQVCNLQFNPVERDELVVANGWSYTSESNAAVSLWSTEKGQACMKNLVELPVSMRPCQLALSADGLNVAVGTGEGLEGGMLTFFELPKGQVPKEDRARHMVGGIAGRWGGTLHTRV